MKRIIGAIGLFGWLLCAGQAGAQSQTYGFKGVTYTTSGTYGAQLGIPTTSIGAGLSVSGTFTETPSLANAVSTPPMLQTVSWAQNQQFGTTFGPATPTSASQLNFTMTVTVSGVTTDGYAVPTVTYNPIFSSSTWVTSAVGGQLITNPSSAGQVMSGHTGGTLQNCTGTPNCSVSNDTATITFVSTTYPGAGVPPWPPMIWDANGFLVPSQFVPSNSIGLSSSGALASIAGNLAFYVTSVGILQTLSFGGVPSIKVGGTGTVTATATSGLAVALTSSTPTTCSISGTTVSGLAAGTCTIAANQAGDSTYFPAAQVVQSFNITSPLVTGLAPISLTYGAQQVGTKSATQAVTLTNGGASVLQIGLISVTGKFPIQTSTCGTVIGAGATCTFGVAFTPSATGAVTGTLSVGTIGSVSLSGTGIAPSISLGTGTFAYGSVTKATNATFTLSNSGTAPLIVSKVGLNTGTHFKVATGGSCIVGAKVAANGTCTVIVTFTPSGTTSFTDTLTLTGTGIGAGAPSYSATRSLSGR